MDEDNDFVDRLVQLAEEAFDIAARRTSFSAGGTLTVPVTIPDSEAGTPIEEVLQRLSRLGYTAAHTTGTSSFTVTRTNMSGRAVMNDSETLRDITVLLGRMMELQSQLLQESAGLSRAEVIALTSLIWSVLYGVLQVITGR
ncbi:MAG TPA: hypothetical protein VGL46_12345 [Pseudonocardiaceae bacterium]|jgi:hypothetical protein